MKGNKSPLVDENTYCSLDCPYFWIKEGHGYCEMLSQFLDFCDWYLAKCIAITQERKQECTGK